MSTSLEDSDTPTTPHHEERRDERDRDPGPPSLGSLAERLADLDRRDFLSRHADLVGPHGGSHEPLTVQEHLRRLAISEAIAQRARQFRASDIHLALGAGASWPDIAKALGTPLSAVHAVYRRWAEGQHDLYEFTTDREHRLGLDDREYGDAIARLDGPEAQR